MDCQRGPYDGFVRGLLFTRTLVLAEANTTSAYARYTWRGGVGST
jgi:hypothetical protein